MIISLNDNIVKRFFDEEFKLFNTDEVKFTDDIYYVDSDDIEDDEEIEDYKLFGCIERNGVWYIPANLEFELKKPTNSHEYFKVSRKGIDLSFIDTDDMEIDIELTKFGEQCYKASKMFNMSIDDVREDIINYSKCFNISIEN